MSNPIYCKFNMDTACVEDDITYSVQQRTELMKQMYNALIEYPAKEKWPRVADGKRKISLAKVNLSDIIKNRY